MGFQQGDNTRPLTDYDTKGANTEYERGFVVSKELTTSHVA